MTQYKERPEIVEAMQIKTVLTIELGYNHMGGEKGDWLVQHEDGRFEIMKDKDFRAKYERMCNTTVPYTYSYYPNVTYTDTDTIRIWCNTGTSSNTLRFA